MIPVKSYSRLNAIYDSIPAAIDREIEKVLAKYDAPQIMVKKEASFKSIGEAAYDHYLRLEMNRQAQEDWGRRTGVGYGMHGASQQNAPLGSSRYCNPFYELSRQRSGLAGGLIG
jgi:hypothetical protein